MKSLKKLTCLLSLLAAFFIADAQNSVTGKVTDASGKGIPGINVLVKGTKKGTSTKQDGSFTISAPAGATLVISGIGYATQDVAVNDRATIDVTLVERQSDLNTVVVTALGIKREKKALTYAAQQIGGDQLRVAANTNFMDAMSGKVAGVNIETSSSGAGGSTKAVLRGNKSLTGLSQPLYVIDGVPLVNNLSAQPGSYGGRDAGDGLSAINPADIESISVLRGANAAILYGSLGANGVILITTKKGKAGKVTIDFSSSTIFDRASTLPDFQFRYGSVGGDYSWTPPASGTPVSSLINTKSPIANVQSSSYQKDYIKNFFRTGTTATNSVAVHGGNDKTTTYFSYANTSANGILPTNTYGKNQFTFNQSTKLLNDKLVVSSNVMFTSEKSFNRPGAGYYNNPLTGLYLFARDRDFNNYKQNYAIFDSARNMPKMNWYSTEEKQNNPYWELNKDPKLQTSNRAIADIKLGYQIDKHTRFEVRGNLDYNAVILDYRYAADGNSVSVSPNGTWNYTRYTDKSLYTDAILTYNNTFGDFSLNGLVGASYQKNIFNDGMNVNNGTTSLKFPNFYSFSNMPSNVLFNQTINRSLKQGGFADLTFGYKDFLFLDVAARNDWASTLALTGNQSYLYPSIGASAVISQMVKLPEAISFFKVRASLSQTANEVPFNVVNPWDQVALVGINPNTQVPFTNLKPEKIVSNEYGTEMRFLKGRLGFDFTVYNGTSTNQFLTLPAPSGSGYTFYYVNAGKITNNGFEFTLDAEPISNKDFSWRTSFNGSRNVNKIVTLIASNPGYVIGGQDEGFDSRIMAGGSFNDLWIYKFARNTAGQIILSSKNVPTKATLETKVGNVNPDFLLGWNNNFTYKNFFASVLVDGKFGGVCFSKTEAFLDSYGVSERTAAARDKGSIPISAISGTTAVTSIDPYTYYQAVGDRNGIMEPYVFSRTNVRLAQLVLGYTFRSQKANPIFKDASVSLIGRNLFFFYKKAPFDPEQAMSTSNSMQSNDVFTMPATRSFGFNVKFTF
ncbi:MAG: SusC/RagA family TonB-linked outer membrane protein [Bacteroidetes bacterium]|nr:SusC/RagA family TonB-linked outer membrane protein [Bacteroidota bacterium]